MAEVSSPIVLKQIETLFGVGTSIGLPDGALLDRFIAGPDEDSEAAFLALVERHGPMVLRVCRQILGNSHDAEDASQATFLVLARKARTIRRMDSAASWLYGVASRIAARARVEAARRRRHERRSMEKSIAIERAHQGHQPETWPELYEELGRLPERLRQPIVLFHLEGLSYEQMARQFGCPVRPLDVRPSDPWVVHVIGRVPDDRPACRGNPDPHGPRHRIYADTAERSGGLRVENEGTCDDHEAALKDGAERSFVRRG